MSKMTDYQSGREDGMLLAEQLVKDGGLERLQEEIKYRGITGVHTQLAKKELEKASEQIKMNTLDTVLLLAISAIRDECYHVSDQARCFLFHSVDCRD